MKKAWTWGLVATMVGALTVSALAAEPAGKVLVAQDFDTVADGTLPAGFTNMFGKWEVKSGKLIGTSTDLYAASIVQFGDAAWDNYMFEVEVTFNSVMNPTRWIGVMFWADPSGKPYYQLAMRQQTTNANGLEIAFKKPDGNWDVPKERTAANAYVFELGTTHKIVGLVYAGNVRYYVDGKLVLSANNLPAPNKGMLGLAIAGGVATFDNVKVTAIDPSNPPVL